MRYGTRMNAIGSLGLVCALLTAGCATSSRAFEPDSALGAHYEVPSRAEEKSAIDLVVVSAKAEPAADGVYDAMVHLRVTVRNAERVPIYVERLRLLGAGHQHAPAEVRSDRDMGGLVLPGSTAVLDVIFALPPGEDPLGELDDITIAWSYQVGKKHQSHRTRFRVPPDPAETRDEHASGYSPFYGVYDRGLYGRIGRPAKQRSPNAAIGIGAPPPRIPAVGRPGRAK